MSEKPWKVGKDIFGAAHVYTGDGDRLTNSHMCRKEGWDEIARLIAAAPDLLEALESVRHIIAEAAVTGFNYKDGDWPERLYESQQATSRAIAKAKG